MTAYDDIQTNCETNFAKKDMYIAWIEFFFFEKAYFQTTVNSNV